MRTNKKVMLYLLIIAVASLIATYIFSLAITLKWIEFNYLSYNFLLSIFSGIFASTIVAFLIEFKSYRNNKRETETKIMGNLLVLYIELHTQYSQGEMYLKNKNIRVPKNLFSERSPTIDKLARELYSFDYEPIFKKKNKLYNSFGEFRNTKVSELLEYLNISKFYNIAINQEETKGLELGKHIVPTSEFEMIKVALKKIILNAQERQNDINNVLNTYPQNRFDWKATKKSIDSNKPSYESDELNIKNFFQTN